MSSFKCLEYYVQFFPLSWQLYAPLIKSKFGKNINVLDFDHVMSVKCEELTVRVWLLYHDLNFKYCTLNIHCTQDRIIYKPKEDIP